jgi:hypothetical protein
MGSQLVPHRSQLLPPFKPLLFGDFTSRVNGLTHSYDEINDYINPVDVWMEEILGIINQPSCDLGLLLHECNLTLVPNPKQ